MKLKYLKFKNVEYFSLKKTFSNETRNWGISSGSFRSTFLYLLKSEFLINFKIRKTNLLKKNYQKACRLLLILKN